MKGSILVNKLTEWILVTVISASLSINLFQAFLVPDSQRWDVFRLIILTALVSLILQLLFFNKKAALISVILLFILFAGSVLFLHLSGDLIKKAGTVQPYLFTLISLLCCVLVFAAAKTRPGILLLFVGGIIAFFFLCVLQYQKSLVGFVLFLCCTAILLLQKQFVVNGARFAGKALNALPYTVIICVLCGISLSFSSLIYLAVKPVIPKPQKLTLLTSPTVIKVAYNFGIATAAGAADSNLDTSLDTAPKETKNKKPIDQDNQRAGEEKNSNPYNPDSKPGTTPPAPQTNKNNTKNATRITYYTHMPWYVYPIIITGSIILLLILPFLLKGFSRRMWYRNIKKLDDKKQVLLLYSYFIKTLGRFGYRKKPNQTPTEYAKSISEGINTIRFGTTDFNEVTSVFVKASYGGIMPGKIDTELMHSFYRGFRKSCKNDAGGARYVLKYLFI